MSNGSIELLFFCYNKYFGKKPANRAEMHAYFYVSFRCGYFIVTIIGMWKQIVIFVSGHRQTNMVKLMLTFLQIFAANVLK
jgi:hypothetical protein